jgi:hypothetical protein
MSTSIAPVYLLLEGEAFFDAPAERAWSSVVNYPTWQEYSVNQHVSGEPGGVGEVVLLKKEEGFAFPAFYARTITLEPPRRLIAKTYPVDARQTGIDNVVDFFGIVRFTVDEVDERSRFSWSTLYEFVVRYQDEHELDAFRTSQNNNFTRAFASVLPKLQRLVEDGPSAEKDS